MNLLPAIDLNTIAPVAGLAAIAVVIILALLLRAMLHSRIALVIAIVIGIIAAGPALGAIASHIIGTLAIVVIVMAIAGIAALLIIRSHPDLLALAHETLSLLPHKASPEQAPPLALPPAADRPTSITVIDQPPARRIVHRNSGSDWGF